MTGILTGFDFPSELYAGDVKPIAASTIERFGLREWKLVVLTGEIHGHLGIYSTIGAKMGLYARELFESQGLSGHISIVSRAGSVPPVSCLNDGLQISTGATLGHGLISIAGGTQRPEATFTCGGKTISLKLHPRYQEQIRSDIDTAVNLYGHSPAYWQRVRELAIRYWSTWNRREIFLCDSSL